MANSVLWLVASVVVLLALFLITRLLRGHGLSGAAGFRSSRHVGATTSVLVLGYLVVTIAELDTVTLVDIAALVVAAMAVGGSLTLIWARRAS